MPVDEDYAREERIRRLRRIVTAGQAHLLYVHEAVPTYLRLGTMSDESTNRLFGGHDTFAELATPELQRETHVSIGWMVDQHSHGTYTRIYRWIADSDNSSPRNLSDALALEYSRVPRLFQITATNSEETVESQLGRLAELIEQRLLIFAAQLRIDGEFEDVTPALRDAAGGWPHLRGQLPDSVLDGYLATMRKRRTRSDIAGAIGAAKEVVEATMKVLAAKHGAVPTATAPDLHDWWRALRPHLVDAQVEAALGAREGAVLKLISGEVATVQALGELRNRVGTGHGRTAHPAGLTAAHALLAVDTAHTVTRFLVG
ncbi:abortive infection family protein [Microbacterium sp. P03]|uniref:abortive infection family protein n=1 Tax=Microbacterium sp. P03 TaxID=3366946 RepID=UPI003745D41A